VQTSKKPPPLSAMEQARRDRVAQLVARSEAREKLYAVIINATLAAGVLIAAAVFLTR
jgi:hypothetical protein